MDLDGFDQTQAIALDDFSDDTDDLGDPENKQPVGYVKVFSQKSFKETSFPVYEGDNFIGRHESNQICIPLKALSKKHACIEIQGDSHLIYDLESRNKTRRGKLFLKPLVRYEFQGDDSLIFGDVTCQFIQVEIEKKSAEQVLDSDDGSETDSELMLQDIHTTGEKSARKKEADFGSSSSYDILQPTQAYVAAESEKKKIILETPQRDGPTLVFAEPSDENVPSEPVKAFADSSICQESVVETPGSKPLAESTVLNESYADEETDRTRNSDLDFSAFASAPTQAYRILAEQETQAYPTISDTDQDDEEEDGRRSLFDAPTQAFGVPDSEEEENEMEYKTAPRVNKRKSLEPTLILNLSTDDEKSLIKEPTRNKPSPQQDIAKEATLAYDDADASETEEHPRGTNNEEAATLAFADLATQAYCTEEEDQSDGEVSEVNRKTEQALDPTLKYDMWPESTQDAPPNRAEAETLPYCAETESDTDSEREQGMEPTLKYNMGVEDSEGPEAQSTRGMDLAMEQTLAYTTEEGDEEEIDISALAGAATQAYTSNDSDSDQVEAEPKSNKLIRPKAKEPSINTNIAEEPTLAYDENTDDKTTEAMNANHSDEATLAYDDIDDDEPMDTEMTLDDEGDRRTMGYEELATQPAGGMESESDPVCNPHDLTRQCNTTEDDDEDDTTAATQAYGMNDDDEEEATPEIYEKPSTCISEKQTALEAGQDEMGGDGGTGGMGGKVGKVGTGDTKMRREGNDAIDDFTVATQVYGADEEGETQVPDSQEGAEPEEQPLVGLSHRISSMLRKVPERSALASPEKKQPQRGRRVAFMEQTPPEEPATEEINKTTRKSGRGRKAKIQEPLPPRVTETDAKPTRRKSKDLRMTKDEEEAEDATRPIKAGKSKRKGSRDIVEGEVKTVDGDSTEDDALEVKEGDGMVWKSTGGLELPEVNNNIISKPASRRTTRRQASYKKAVNVEDSDDTESISSTSSLQVEVVDPAGGSVKSQAMGRTEMTVCDGKQSKDVVKPRRGRRRRSNATKEGISKVSDTSLGKGKKSMPEIDEPAPEVGRPASIARNKQTRRSVLSKVETVKNTKQSSNQSQPESESDDVPEKKEVSSSGKGTRSSRGRHTAGEKQQLKDETDMPSEEKEMPVRRGRKPKALAIKKTPQAKGQKQSSIMDYALVVEEDMERLKISPGEDRSANLEDEQSNQTDSLETNDSMSLLSTAPQTTTKTARSRRTRSNLTETPSPQQSAKQETFLAPEPVKRGGRMRRGTKEEDRGQESAASLSNSSLSETGIREREENVSRGKGGKKGRKSAVLETTKKEEQPAATPSSNRRGKKPSTPTLSTPTASSAKKLKEPETPEGEVASPSLRRRPSETKPKVMFTGVIDKSWQKIVTSLGGELVDSVFNCTHLVTDKVRRTVKFLCCLSRGTLIVMPDWLDQCKENKAFIDPIPYLVKDKAAEKQHGFSHVTSHQRALQGGVLTKLRIFVTANVKPEPEHMKEIVLCAGGKFLSSIPVKADANTVIVSCEADKARCLPAIKAGVCIVSAEFILTGMLRQEIQLELFQLFTPTSTTSERGTKRKVNDTPSSSKRRR